MGTAVCSTVTSCRVEGSFRRQGLLKRQLIPAGPTMTSMCTWPLAHSCALSFCYVFLPQLCWPVSLNSCGFSVSTAEGKEEQCLLISEGLSETRQVTRWGSMNNKYCSQIQPQVPLLCIYAMPRAYYNISYIIKYNIDYIIKKYNVDYFI